MTAELLRRAAAQMRERAQAATPSPWRDSHADGNRYSALVSDTMPRERREGGGWDDTTGYGGYLIGESIQTQDRAHIASWHPDVALAAARLLEVLADVDCMCGLSSDDPHCEHSAAHAFARAYLGEPA